MRFAARICAMRHDPASAAVVVMLRGLKMYGMAQAVSDLMEQGSPAFGAAVPILSQLLKAEVAEREVRSIAYQIKAARFPAYKDLAGFDFASSEVNEAMVRQLHRGEFIVGADNVVLIGGPESDSYCSSGHHLTEPKYSDADRRTADAADVEHRRHVGLPRSQGRRCG
jgi:hypothetical protein